MFDPGKQNTRALIVRVWIVDPSGLKGLRGVARKCLGLKVTDKGKGSDAVLHPCYEKMNTSCAFPKLQR